MRVLPSRDCESRTVSRLHAVFGAAAVPLCAIAKDVSIRAQQMVRVNFFTIVTIYWFYTVCRTKNRAIGLWVCGLANL